MKMPGLAVRLAVYLVVVVFFLSLGALSHRDMMHRNLGSFWMKRNPATRAATLVGLASEPLGAVLAGYEPEWPGPSVELWQQKKK
jgi:hypothetical protein